jgi:hypothetical protein
MLLIAASLLFAAQTADYFPLTPGLTWEYEVSIEGTVISAKQVMKSLEPTKIEGEAVVPVQVWLDGRLDSTAYYRVGTEFVFLAATDGKALMSPQVPVLPVAPKAGQKWDFDGTTRVLGGGAGTKVKSKVIGTTTVEVMGEKRAALRIESEATLGSGPNAMNTKTVEMYVAGIGLVYRKQEYKSKQSGSAVMRLVKFSGASG